MRFTIQGKPISQTRARISKNFFYDPLFQVKKNIRSVIKEQLPEGFKPLAEPIELKVTFFMQTPKALPKQLKKDLKDRKEIPHAKLFDLDNGLKFLLDSFNGLLWEDDRFIWKASVKKVWSLKGKTVFDFKPTSANIKKT